MIDPAANVDASAHVDETVTIGAGSIVRQFASLSGGTVIGRDCSIAPFACLHGPVIGDRCRINSGTLIAVGTLLEDDVFIGPNVTFCNDAWPSVSKAGFNPEQYGGARWSVVVEDGASVGAGAVILPGVRIGAGALVAAGAVVSRDVLPDHLILGIDGECRPIPPGEKTRMRFAG